jgi:hypothetical protein
MFSQPVPAGRLSLLDDDQCPLGPEAIRLRLGLLIGRYLREGSTDLAQSIVTHLDALCQDPDLRDPDLFCAYRRLVRHWRWLSAWQGALDRAWHPSADQA